MLQLLTKDRSLRDEIFSSRRHPGRSAPLLLSLLIRGTSCQPRPQQRRVYQGQTIIEIIAVYLVIGDCDLSLSPRAREAPVEKGDAEAAASCKVPGIGSAGVGEFIQQPRPSLMKPLQSLRIAITIARFTRVVLMLVI